MPEDKSAVEDFLGSLNKKEVDPFKSSDPFAAKEEAVTEVIPEVEEVEEKALPFHKDPKVLKFIEKEVGKRVASVKPVEAISKETDDEITDVLTRIIGNDTPEKQAGIKDLRKVLVGLEEKGAQKALAQLEQQAQAERDKDEKAQQELESSFEDIEESYGVDLSSNTATARKTRSEFIDYIRKIAPKNSEGEVVAFPDMSSAFEEFQSKTKPTTNRAKELASRGMSRSTDASAAPAVADKSWKGVEKLFSKLTN